MLELLFLLLPVAAAYGWFMALYTQKQKELKEKASVTRNFSSGLNFLLTDQEDKAIEQLLALLDIEAATIDTYLALANLFRRRGDWDKAIRIHEKLTQLKLPKSQAPQIKFELAKDYFSAGLYDRAEALLADLVHHEALKEAVLKQLFALFVVTHDWPKAQFYQGQVSTTESRSLRIALANMLCEGQKNPSIDYLRQLSAWYPAAVRPRMLLAEKLQQNAEHNAAKEIYITLLKEKPQWAADVLPKLAQCQVDEQQWYQLLSSLSHQQKNVTAIITLSDWYQQTGAGHAAEQLLLEKLTNQPNIRIFKHLLKIRQQLNPQDAAALQSIEQLIQAYLETKVLYSCRSCGFKTKQKYWLCPSCQQWETVEPAAGIDGR